MPTKPTKRHEKETTSKTGGAWANGYDAGMKIRIWLGLLAMTGLAGCASTPEKRIAKEPEVFAAMPAETQAKIRAGQVEVGFTMTQVKLAKGKPDRVGRRTTASGEEEVWTYERRKSGLSFGVGVGGGSGGMGGGVGVSTGTGYDPDIDMRVIFAGGVVSAVEDYQK